MDKEKVLKEIFENDPLGLLNVKPTTSYGLNEDGRLISSFNEINVFYETNNREPELGKGVQEHQLYARLKSIRENPSKMEQLKPHDNFGLLDFVPKEINSLDDILNDDLLGILDGDDIGLFDLKHVPKFEDRNSADFIARRKACKDFDNYEHLFKGVQTDLKSGKRKLIKFKQENLREKCFYVHNGVLLYLDSVKFEKQIQKFNSGVHNRPDGRTKTVFENGTESNMMFQSLYKALHENGQVVSENVDNTNQEFLEKYSNINDEDEAAGFIYILKSKSNKQEIKEINNLFKIGFSKVSVEERIKNASQEPTYLMADVRVVMAYKCFNMNTHKLEQLLHGFFGRSCLNIDVFDLNGNRHTPREWFIAPLEVIEQAIQFIIAGAIVKYKYDDTNEKIVER